MSLALATGACGDTSETRQGEGEASTAIQEFAASTKRAATEISATDCGRDEAGQVSCLVSAFDLKECGEAKVLGSMFRANEAEETFEHRTAFGLDNACFAELETAARRRNFNEDDKGELVAKSANGYRETLIIGLQISADGSVVEWERTQE